MNGWKIAGIFLGSCMTAAYLIWKIVYIRIRNRLRRELREAG